MNIQISAFPPYLLCPRKNLNSFHNAVAGMQLIIQIYVYAHVLYV